MSAEAEFDSTPWTPEEEKAVMRKVNFRFVPWMIICYGILLLDRNSLANAKIMNTETPSQTLTVQLGLGNNDYNWAVSVFFVTFVIFEIPSNFLLTQFKPSMWISRIMISWGICAGLLAAAQNMASLCAIRMLLGLMEAGYAPGMALLMTYWYKKYEVSSRFAFMYAGAFTLSSFGGLFAYAVAHLDGIRDLAGFRWLFIVEGLISVVAGFLTYFILPDYPQTATFLTPRERQIVIERLPPTGPTIHAKTIVWGEVWDGLKDWRLHAIALACLLEFTPAYAFSAFSPTVITLMGFQSTTAQLLSMAPTICTGVFTLIINWSSDYFQEKKYHALACGIPPALGYFLLATIQGRLSSYGRYALLFLVSIENTIVPMLVGYSSITTKGMSKTALRSAYPFAIGNLGGIIGPQIYRSDDAPLYTRGHFINGTCIALMIVTTMVLMLSIEREGLYTGAKANLTVRDVADAEALGVMLEHDDEGKKEAVV